jgi:hypothetical protein
MQLRLGNDQRAELRMDITGDDAGETESLTERSNMQRSSGSQSEQKSKLIRHSHQARALSLWIKALRRSITLQSSGTNNGGPTLKQRGATTPQAAPKLLDFVVGGFLSDLAVALQANNQANTISKLLEVLVKGKPLWSPVVAAVMTEPLQGGANAIPFGLRA